METEQPDVNKEWIRRAYATAHEVVLKLERLDEEMLANNPDLADIPVEEIPREDRIHDLAETYYQLWDEEGLIPAAE